MADMRGLQMPPPVDWTAGYRAERERSKAEMNERAAYASALAEQLGHYTPELQEAVLAPMGQYPTIGESLISAPIRAMGKLFGSEKMQQLGAPQPFQITGPPEPPPVMPDLPAGVPEDMREFMKQYAQSQGFQFRPKGQTVPNLPSEYSTSQPMLKTKRERGMEDDVRKNFWDVMGKTYKSQAEQEAAQQKIAESKQMIEESKAKIKDWESKEGKPMPVTFATMIHDYIQKHPELDAMDVIMRYKEGAGKLPSAKIQEYNLAVSLGFQGTPDQWEARLSHARSDPGEMAYQTFYSNKWLVMNTAPEDVDKVLKEMTDRYITLMNQINTGAWGPPPAEGGKGGKGGSYSGASTWGGGKGAPTEPLPGQPNVQPPAAPSAPKGKFEKPGEGAKERLGPPQYISQETLAQYNKSVELPPELVAQKVNPMHVMQVMQREGVDQQTAVNMIKEFYDQAVKAKGR